MTKKITSVGSDPTLRKFALDPVVVIFFEMKKFSFQKKYKYEIRPTLLLQLDLHRN